MSLVFNVEYGNNVVMCAYGAWGEITVSMRRWTRGEGAKLHRCMDRHIGLTTYVAMDEAIGSYTGVSIDRAASSCCQHGIQRIWLQMQGKKPQFATFSCPESGGHVHFPESRIIQSTWISGTFDKRISGTTLPCEARNAATSVLDNCIAPHPTRLNAGLVADSHAGASWM